VLGGALLLTPGFITDICGALLLLPPVRAFLYRRLGGWLEHHAAGPPGTRPPDGAPPVLEGEFEELGPEDLPPPRGGWDRPR
jgi:UPF0716 protein FxsA